MVLILNAFICFLICLRLFIYRRPKGKRYRPLYSWLAWVLMCCCASISILVFFGWVQYIFIAELLINSVILCCLMRSRGNVATFLTTLQHEGRVV